MFRLRPALPALTAGLMFAATDAAAHGQAVRIEDIQVLVEDGRFQTLIRLSEQPVGARVVRTDQGLTVEIDGVELAPFDTRAAPGSAIRSVAAFSHAPGASRIELSGVAVGSAETVIYRHAVMIEGRLAEANLDGGDSLLSKPDLGAPAPARTVVAAVPETAEAEEQTALPQLSQAGLPEAITPASTCAAYADRLKADAWDTGALGPAALCLIDEGKAGEARPLIERLAAFSPDDWLAEFGRARLAELGGDFSQAEIGYRNALVLARNDADRARVKSKLDALTRPPA